MKFVKSSPFGHYKNMMETDEGLIYYNICMNVIEYDTNIDNDKAVRYLKEVI